MSIVYNYHDYTKKGVELPEDINSLPVETAEKLDSTGDLKSLLDSAQDKRLFGQCHYLGKNGDRLIAVFEYHNGICKKFNLLEWSKGNTSYFMRTILNDKVSFKRN